MKPLPRSVLGWMMQQRSVKEVIKHKGQGKSPREYSAPQQSRQFVIRDLRLWTKVSHLGLVAEIEP